MQIALCDNCGKEVIGEQGERLPGYYLSALYVDDSMTVQGAAYACANYCIQGAIEGALTREGLTDAAYEEAIKELWARGKGLTVVDTYPALPVVRLDDPTQQIGSAQVLRKI